jgi:hypothetical protein
MSVERCKQCGKWKDINGICLNYLCPSNLKDKVKIKGE